MADGLEWLMKFADEMSGTSARIATSLERLEKELQKSADASKKLDEEQKKASEGAKEHGESMFAEVFKAEALEHALEAVAEKVMELGTEFLSGAVEANDYADHVRNALDVITGSSEVAENILKDAEQYSLAAALPLHEVEDAYKRLANARVAPADMRTFVTAASEIEKLGGGPMSSVVDQFAKISNRGQMTGRDLMFLANSGLHVDEMAKRLGAGSFHELQEKLSTEPIAAAIGLNAILMTLQEQEHGSIGAITSADAKTVGGSIQKIKTGWDEMLESVNKAPEWGEFRAGLAQIAELFDSNTVQGAQFQAEIRGVLVEAEQMFNEFLTNKDGLISFLHDASELAHLMLEAVEGIAHHWQSVGGAAAGFAVAGPVGAAALGGAGLAVEGMEKREEVALRHGFSEEQALEMSLPHQKFASGGVVSGSTFAQVGEAGTEIISPEDKMRELFREVSGGNGGGRQVVVKVELGGIHVGEGVAGDKQAMAEHLTEVAHSTLLSAFEEAAEEVGGQ